METPLALLDTDTLSEVMKGRDATVQKMAGQYLAAHSRFSFSILTRYEILRGLRAKNATRQVALFEQQCQKSLVLPLTDDVVIRAAELYALLHKRGKIINDADILIAATALVHGLILVTENTDHFARIPELALASWRTPIIKT